LNKAQEKKIAEEFALRRHVKIDRAKIVMPGHEIKFHQATGKTRFPFWRRISSRMTANAQLPQQPADEIDLILLVERTLRFFRQFRWLYLSAAIIGLTAGWFVYNYLPTVYKSRMVAHSFLLTNQEQIKMIENWNELLAKKEYMELANATNSNPPIFRKVKKINADELQKVFTPTNPNGYYIEVTVTDNSVLDSLQGAIVSGIENSNFVSEKLASRRSNLKELITKTSAEIVKLDSTKQTLENIIEGKGRTNSSLIIEGASINKQLIEMNEKLLSFQDELKFTAAVQVLQGFSKFSQPSGPHLFPWLVFGLIFFMTLASVYAFFASIARRLRERRQFIARETI
jgi:hypothetical protein